MHKLIKSQNSSLVRSTEINIQGRFKIVFTPVWSHVKVNDKIR